MLQVAVANAAVLKANREWLFSFGPGPVFLCFVLLCFSAVISTASKHLHNDLAKAIKALEQKKNHQHYLGDDPGPNPDTLDLINLLPKNIAVIHQHTINIHHFHDTDPPQLTQNNAGHLSVHNPLEEWPKKSKKQIKTKQKTKQEEGNWVNISSMKLLHKILAE